MKAAMAFNPFELILQVFNDLYPGKAASVEWVSGLRQERNAWGSTVFEEGKAPEVLIDVRCPVAGAIEVLAHELAHVAAGVPHDDADGHGDEWEAAFEAIHREYSQRVVALGGDGRKVMAV